MKKTLASFLAILLIVGMLSFAFVGDGHCDEKAPETITLVWPPDCTAVDYDDLHSIADYLLLFAWTEVKGSEGYLMTLIFDRGDGGKLLRWDGPILNQYLIFLEGLAIWPIPLDEAGWNAIAPYVITWQVRALEKGNDFSSVTAVSPKHYFTLNPVVE